MDTHTILNYLKTEDPFILDELWTRADKTRRQHVGDDVHLRGLLEISNHCVRHCAYCGLNADNEDIVRYRMKIDEIVESARLAAEFCYGTVVLQAGEDYAITQQFMCEVIHAIKQHTSLAITLSLGERSYDDLAAWRQAGANRYLLRFETSNRRLFQAIHPSLPSRPADRIHILGQLRKLGYEVGSGVMIGIPGQSYDDLANDILLFGELDLDMIGVGPFIAHPATAMGRTINQRLLDDDRQVPATELMAYKVVALARIVCPQANIPSTTAIATLNNENGRELGLQRGANVIMPNVTPPHYRQLYQIYPGKACLSETAQQCNACINNRIARIGRTIGTGPGTSPRYQCRRTSADQVSAGP